MEKLFSYVRLLPILMVVCGFLLVIKAVGISEQAYAQVMAPGAAPAQTAMPQTPRPRHDIAQDRESSSPSEVDLLTGLSKRRAELDAQANTLSMRENLIVAAERRVEERIAALKQVQGQIEALLAKRDAAQEAQIATLVKTYSAMKPADAARIFGGLNDGILVPVAGAMKPDVLAPILAKMPADVAQRLTLKLANRLNLPEDKPVTVAANQTPAPATAIAPPNGAAPVLSTPPAAAAAAPPQGATPQVNPPQAKTGG
ncbi:MAG TPA: hypothetical protein VL026_00090 [Rhizomicrobium sp.]|nr:hypothetical protein [Rhizomicrobium sp.]